eukprot:TRINITY_DN31953_c0_g1_i3.p1 TRINITY_DN31953_c0_g1~~TRINITY_DN31953_c0_g1_i3.p1  ORF type:complete len:173 (+),score=18.47 TRINITY_DN31953_c0_g1_i3:35-520(+)
MPSTATLGLLLLFLFAFCCHIGADQPQQFVCCTSGLLASSLGLHNFRKAVRECKQPQRQVSVLVLISILLSEDIHCNPGPRTKSVYPCGLCEQNVQWTDCVGCDGCDVWYHKSCIELSTKYFQALQRASIQWLCYKCDSINCGSSTFRSFSSVTKLLLSII